MRTISALRAEGSLENVALPLKAQSSGWNEVVFFLIIHTGC